MDSEPAKRSFLRRRRPLLLVLLVLAGLFAYLALASTAANEGSFTYTLDDAYIHLELARNLAEHGSWGIEPGRFDAAASSLGWPLLLALATLIFGNAVLAPLILAVSAAGALMWIMEGYLDRLGVEAPYRPLILLAAFYISAALFGVFSGMEHVLHLIMVAALLLVVLPTLDEERRTWRRAEWLSLSLALLAVTVRYESLFAVAVVVLLALLRKRWLFAAALAVAGWLPVVVYGLVSTANGAYFLPNSILVKTLTRDAGYLEQLLTNVYTTLRYNITYTIGLGSAAVLWVVHWRKHGFWHPIGRLAFCVLGASLFSLLMLRSGYRYHIWVIFLLYLVAALLAWSLLTRLRSRLEEHPRLKWALIALVGLLLLHRFFFVLPEHPLQATRNIYRQQRQTARFLDRYYADEAVAVNDIGAVGYYADVEVLDLWGLASQEVAELKLAGAYDSAAIERLVAERDAACAVVYDDWFRPYGGLPTDWIACARWTIPDNVVCGGDTVTFYAFDEAGAAALRKHLGEFVPELPPEVVVTALNDAQP